PAELRRLVRTHLRCARRVPAGWTGLRCVLLAARHPRRHGVQRDRPVPVPRDLLQLRDHRDARVWRRIAEKRAGAKPRDRRGARWPDVPGRLDRPTSEPLRSTGGYLTTPGESSPRLLSTPTLSV